MSSSSVQPNHTLHSQSCQAKAMATLGNPLEGQPCDGPPGAVDDVVGVSKSGGAAGRAAGSGSKEDEAAEERGSEGQPSRLDEAVEEVVDNILSDLVAAVLVEDGTGGSPAEGLDIGAELWARSWASIPGYKKSDEEREAVPARFRIGGSMDQEKEPEVGAEGPRNGELSSSSSWSREGGQGFPEITHLYLDDMVVEVVESGRDEPVVEAVWARYVRRRGEPEEGQASSTPGTSAEDAARFHDQRLVEAQRENVLEGREAGLPTWNLERP